MKTKTQISFAVTAKLISVLFFATQIVQSLYFKPLAVFCGVYRPVCVGPGRKSRRPVFSQRGSNYSDYFGRAYRLYVRGLLRCQPTCCKILNEPLVRKPAFCICKNKDADQLRGNHEADQRLCFRYLDSTIPLLPKSEISSL